jgi:S-adenosylmethionine decarboxylase
MVTIEVPNNSTLSPPELAPSLTINHDVAADLDSSNAFEGPEKLLEVWFAPDAKSLPAGVKENGLKAVSPSAWETMLDMVNCKVLSIIKHDHMDAYLLSESSMFVFPHKLILKTCGTTTLLLGLHRLMHLAAVDAGFPIHNALSVDDVRAAATPFRVFYSRKNFLFPDKQRGPHRSWKEEVKYLDDMFENGSAYMVGKMNGDHWYLYITSPNSALTPPSTPDRERHDGPLKRACKIPTGIAYPFQLGGESGSDETLEVLMTDLDPELAKQFYLSDASKTANQKYADEAEKARHDANAELAHLPGSLHEAPQLALAANGRDAHQADQQIVTEALTTEGHALGTVVSEHCGLADVYPTSLYPDARIDSYMFTPCGFSANAVIPSPSPWPVSTSSDPQTEHEEVTKANNDAGKGCHYFTMHVTPEPACSYASFETNVPGGLPGRETRDIVEHVVRIFRPGRFSVTLFQAKHHNPHWKDGSDDMQRIVGGLAAKQRIDKIKGYRRVDSIVHDFDDYDLVFRYYEREGWVGNGQARVGED